MHEFVVGEWARVLLPFSDVYPGVYEVVAVRPYDDPETPPGVVDQTCSLDIDLGPDVEPRDFANKHLELVDAPGEH
jgi:hypothetical protein